jgi:hypothetical protein
MLSVWKRGFITRRDLLAGVSCSFVQWPHSACAAQGRVGCLVRRASAESSSPNYKQTTGVAAYDGAVRASLATLESLLGTSTKAQLRFVDEFDAHYNPQGHVLAFGRGLLDRLQKNEFKLQLACVAAHEICHVYQTADAYMDQSIGDKTVRKSVCGKRDVDNSVILRNRRRVEAAFRFFFSLGDSEVNSPQHHGTPDERLHQVSMAYDMAFKEIRGLSDKGEIAYDLLDAARLIE